MKLPTFSRPALKLKPSAGSYSTSPRWSNADLDPVPVRERVWKTLDYANYWIADLLAPPLWATISAAMSLGLTARQAVPITFFGFFICGVAVALNSHTAAVYRVPFSVILRSSFGMWGAIPAMVVRAFVALMWTAISVVQGGGYLENAIGAIWPSYLELPNHFPESAGITSSAFGMVMLFWGIQTSIAIIPINKLRYFFLFKTAVVVPCWFALFLWAVIVTKGGGPLVVGEPVYVKNATYACFTALNIVIGLFSSLAVNMPDFGRFAKSEKAGRYQFMMLPIIGTAGALAPIFVTSAHQYLHGEYEWFMPAVIAQFDSRAARFFTGFSFVIATIGNQIAAGSYPFSIDCSAILPRYFNVFRGTLFMAAFCLISNPWLILKNASALLAFLSGYSCIMGPIAAIMLTNYYLCHKGKLDVRELYHPHGIYSYSHGWNWRAWLSFFCAWGPVAPGFINAIEPTLAIPDGLANLYSASWLFSFTVAGAVYYMLTTYAGDRKTFLDEAVYPAQTEEEEALLAQQSMWRQQTAATVTTATLGYSGATVDTPPATPSSDEKKSEAFANVEMV